MRRRASSRLPPTGRTEAAHLARFLLSRWVLIALCAELALGLSDGLVRNASVLGTSYLVPVLALAAVETGERTATVGLIATVLALVSGVWNDYFLSSDHVYRFVIVAGGTALATLAAAARTRALIARDRMEMLARISEIADGTAPLEESLRRLADVLVPAAADACELNVFQGGAIRRVLTRIDGAPGLEHRLRARSESTSPLVVEAAQTGEAVLITPSGRRGGRSIEEFPDEAAESLQRTGMSSIMYAPLRAGGQTLAVLILAVGPSGRRFGISDLRFARTVGSRAALAIQNASLFTEVHEARQRLEAVVGSLADAVTIRGRSGAVIYANDAARQMIGLSPADRLESLDIEALARRFIMYDERGQTVSAEELPSARLLRGESYEPMVVRFVHRERGEERWRVLKSTPLFDRVGNLEAAVTILEDITETKRAELRSRFLSLVGETLSASLDYEKTLSNVAWLAVPDVADWCAVDLFDEYGQRRQVVAAHRDPDKLKLAQRLRELTPEQLDPRVGLGAVLSTGLPQLYAHIDDELLRRAALSEEHLALLRAVGMRSALVVPMSAGGRVIGAMTLVDAESGRVFAPKDIDFFQQIASRAAVAVENARLYSERARIATTLQHSLLPEALPDIVGWEMASLYRPASSQGAVEVGGDFYDAFATAEGWVVLIGDVTGKGVEAAAMTALVRHGARFVGDYAPEPAEILARLDSSLRQQASLSLCTALCLRIAGDRLTFSSAGHPLPLLVTEGEARSVGQSGSVLGAFPDGHWPTYELTLHARELLLLYTDGVTDTVGADGRFGDERLRATMARCGPVAPDELLSCLDAALSEFQVGPQADDTAALALRLAGRAKPLAPAPSEFGT